MGTGLLIGGKKVPVPGIDVSNYLDDPRLRLAPGDMRPRTPKEKIWVHLVVVHTTGGIPGGSDLRPQKILPGFGPPSGGGERVVASWLASPKPFAESVNGRPHKMTVARSFTVLRRFIIGNS